jgi:mannose-6-phosphate isomerase-like protein (cupin superfamily)
MAESTDSLRRPVAPNTRFNRTRCARRLTSTLGQAFARPSVLHRMTDTLSPIDKTRAEHYSWGAVCDGWRLLTGSDLSVIQECVPPGAAEIAHFHSRARQFFFVLSGVATLELVGRSVTFSQGQGVHVPPGTTHRFANHSRENVAFLVISAPTTKGDRTDVQGFEPA